MKLLEGKLALVTGVANRWSIATGIARRFHEHGARLALTYQGERVKDEVDKLARELGDAHVVQCDVSSDDSLRAMRDDLSANFGKLDALVHSIAYANKEDLAGKVFDTSRSGYTLALEISSFSLIALVRTLREDLNDGASISALTYLGATQIVPNYNLMGIAKAALEASVRYLAFDLGERGSGSTRSRPGRSRLRVRDRSAGFRASWTSFRGSPRSGATLPRKTSATPPSFWPRTSRAQSPPT